MREKLLFNSIKYIFGLVAGLVFASGLVYAWNAMWHGTAWIKAGTSIESRQIAENFEYLYRQIENLKTQLNTGSNSNTNNSASTVNLEQLPSGIPVAGCGITKNDGRSRFAPKYECWGGASYNGSYASIKCPKDTFAFTIMDTTGSYIYGGDGNPQTGYTTNLQGFLCIKQ